MGPICYHADSGREIGMLPETWTETESEFHEKRDMIQIGKFNELSILRKTNAGLVLSGDSDETVLLPRKHTPQKGELTDSLSVFVYRDSQDKLTATTIRPKILLHEFSFLEVTSVIEIGAFLNWGLEKDLFVPVREQKKNMELGRKYVVYMYVDQKTDRLYASSRVNRFLQNDQLTVQVGDEVDLLLLRKTDLGYSVIINHQHQGLIYDNEVFESLHVGEQRKGYVKTIREDNKLDISLQAIGYLNYHDANCTLVHDALVANKGALLLTGKSSPEQIYQQLGISKKAFKKAIGSLYKERRIIIDSDGIRLLEP